MSNYSFELYFKFQHFTLLNVRTLYHCKSDTFSFWMVDFIKQAV